MRAVGVAGVAVIDGLRTLYQRGRMAVEQMAHWQHSPEQLSGHTRIISLYDTYVQKTQGRAFSSSRADVGVSYRMSSPGYHMYWSNHFTRIRLAHWNGGAPGATGQPLVTT
jgi:hypothetical protein